MSETRRLSGLRVFLPSDNKRSQTISREFYLGNISLGDVEEYVDDLLWEIDHVVSMRFMTDKNSFQSHWFSYVEMTSEAEVRKLVSVIDGKLVTSRFSTTVKRNLQMPLSKLCSFCVSAETCKKTETERDSNCKEYMLKLESEAEYSH